MIYEDFKDLSRRTTAEKVFCNEVFNIAINPKYDGYQRGLASLGYKFFMKGSSGGTVNHQIIPNKELIQQLHKPIIRKTKFHKIWIFIMFY